MIYRQAGQQVFNPIRSHLRIDVVQSQRVERVGLIQVRLDKEGFNPDISRCLVFCSSRRLTEELCEEFEELQPAEGAWKRKIGFFHAGMSGDDREEIYKGFRSGSVVVLFATKAFGMGLDIPNIHFILHYEPPSALEDYLQEIGRAGRDPQLLAQAGFSEKHQIQCVFFVDKEDFARQKDRMHRGQLAWSELIEVQDEIHSYICKFQPLVTSSSRSIPLPLDLLNRSPAFSDKDDLINRQRLGLYWLERLKRIKLGSYLPAHLEFKDFVAQDEKGRLDETERKLVEVVQQHRSLDADEILVPTNVLMASTGVENLRDLFKVIAQAQKLGAIELNQKLYCSLTKKRQQEVEYLNEHNIDLPILSIGYSFIGNILSRVSQDRALPINNEFLEQIINEQFDEQQPWPWILNAEKKEKVFQKDLDDLQKPHRKKTFMRLIEAMPVASINSNIEDDEIQYIVRLTSTKWKTWLSNHEIVANGLLKIAFAASKAGQPLNLAETLLELKEADLDIDFLESVIHFLKGMGYFRFSAPMIPMAMDLFLLSIDKIDTSIQDSEDSRALRDFNEQKLLKKLRLAALEALSIIPDSQKDAFIEQYFQCAKSSEIIVLLEQFLETSGTEILNNIRSEALRELVEGGGNDGGLDKDQLAVYNAPLDQSVVVIAGPGSGKTHTLLLRLARLVDEENIPPESILVISYNRAVVAELRHRLKELFSKLGYRNLINRLKVFTFHGLIKYCIPDIAQNISLNDESDRDEWVEYFNKIASDSPGVITQRLGNIRHVFVDEFQDIIKPRLEMLKFLAPVDSSYVTVIGDPDQSIYGYDRLNYDDPIAAEPFFDQFKQDYDAQSFALNFNYRSYSAITDACDQVIQLNQNRIARTRAVSVRKQAQGLPVENSVEVIESDKDEVRWFKKLQNLVSEGKDDGERYRDIAVLLRGNEDVAYRLKEFKEKADPTSLAEIKIRVQGDSSQLIRIREVALIIDKLREEGERPLPEEFATQFIADWLKADIPSAWNRELIEIAAALVCEFMTIYSDNSTYAQLTEYIEEVGAGRLDGHIYKIYNYWREKLGVDQAKTEVVFSTYHKVKGLEFDAVLLPASLASLPIGPKPQLNNLESHIEEERRVLYVGMSRARFRLVRYEWEREKRLLHSPKSMMWRLEGYSDQLGIRTKKSLENIHISKHADSGFICYTLRFRDENEYLQYYEKHIGSGDQLQLQFQKPNWLIFHNKRPIGKASSSLANKLNTDKSYDGIYVNNVVRYHFTESLAYDERNQKNYSSSWSPYFARDRGWTYLVDFSGYLKLISN